MYLTQKAGQAAPIRYAPLDWGASFFGTTLPVCGRVKLLTKACYEGTVQVYDTSALSYYELNYFTSMWPVLLQQRASDTSAGATADFYKYIGDIGYTNPAYAPAAPSQVPPPLQRTF